MFGHVPVRSKMSLVQHSVVSLSQTNDLSEHVNTSQRMTLLELFSMSAPLARNAGQYHPETQIRGHITHIFHI